MRKIRISRTVLAKVCLALLTAAAALGALYPGPAPAALRSASDAKSGAVWCKLRIEDKSVDKTGDNKSVDKTMTRATGRL
jgi:hypothetical protein